MKETKHTKGEWDWQLFGDTYMLTAQHGTREIIIGAIEHGEMKYPVVGMNKNGMLADVDPDHPNSKLIAAAPNMLEALIELEKQIIRLKLSEPQALRIKASRVKAKKAIEKATL